MKMHQLLGMLLAFATTVFIAPISIAATANMAEANINITNAWTRANAPGQDVAAAYLTLQSATDNTLVSIESASAGIVEIHSMSMDNGIMKMRMLDNLPLKAGVTTKLEPGGFHLMLFDLKQPLKPGESVRYTLHFVDAKGKPSVKSFISPVKSAAN